MPADKRAMRDAVRAARSAIGATDRAAASEAAQVRAFSHADVAGARAVLAYAAIAEEIDPSSLVSELRARGARIAYPRVCGPGELTLHWVGAQEELAAGYCGIAEPGPDASEASIEDFDLVIVPGTAFDGTCARLGMGGGFYDRLLARLGPGTFTVALAYDEQIVPCVPVEGHDVALDAVFTPTRTFSRVRQP